VALTLPRTFTPTHQTSGLAGYPAIDVFAPAGTVARAGFWGRVVRVSGRSLSGDERPGGAYGFSVYVRNAVNGWTRYCTHFSELHVGAGAIIVPGRDLGLIATPPLGSPRGSAHIHMGLNKP
jgi:hypothetical protein